MKNPTGKCNLPILGGSKKEKKQPFSDGSSKLKNQPTLGNAFGRKIANTKKRAKVKSSSTRGNGRSFAEAWQTKSGSQFSKH